MTNAEARCNKSLRPRKPEGSLGRTAQDVHLDSHTAPELGHKIIPPVLFIEAYSRARGVGSVLAAAIAAFFFFSFFKLHRDPV